MLSKSNASNYQDLINVVEIINFPVENLYNHNIYNNGNTRMQSEESFS